MAAIASLNSKYLSAFPGKLIVLPEFRGETTWQADPAVFKELMRQLKNEDGFDYLIDVTTVDNYGGEPRFAAVYELYSYGHGLHLRVKTWTDEETATVPTVSDIWATANWHEREAYDMMGVKFDGHPDLRRILMWEGYPYFPLRKEFPLEGKPTEMPDIAFTKPAPLEGGPFVTAPTTADSRKPRAKQFADRV